MGIWLNRTNFVCCSPFAVRKSNCISICWFLFWKLIDTKVKKKKRERYPVMIALHISEMFLLEWRFLLCLLDHFGLDWLIDFIFECNSFNICQMSWTFKRAPSYNWINLIYSYLCTLSAYVYDLQYIDLNLFERRFVNLLSFFSFGAKLDTFYGDNQHRHLI